MKKQDKRTKEEKLIDALRRGKRCSVGWTAHGSQFKGRKRLGTWFFVMTDKADAFRRFRVFCPAPYNTRTTARNALASYLEGFPMKRKGTVVEPITENAN